MNSPPCSGTQDRILKLFPEDSPDSVSSEFPATGINYILCYTPRCGSTHLTSLLRNTGLLGKPADFLNPDYAKLPLDALHVREATGVYPIYEARAQYGIRSVAEYLRLVASLARTPNGVFGMKADFYQTSILLRRSLFRGRHTNWKYIYLTRGDLLAQAISYYRAIQTDQWSSLSGAGKRPCEFDEPAILSAMANLADMIRQWEYVFGLFGINPLRVSYEEIVSAPRTVLGRIASHIGVTLDPEQLVLSSSYNVQRTGETMAWTNRIRERALAFGDPSSQPERMEEAEVSGSR